MDNKQLLIAAAKAAGYAVKEFNGAIRVGHKGYREFDPINDDADAFRLMVDCGIAVEFWPDNVDAYPDGVTAENTLACGDLVQEKYADHNNDKHAATRMAIVRAAAQSQETEQ